MFVECCRQANVSAQVEVGSYFGLDEHSIRPADVLLTNWYLGKPAAFDLTITSQLNPSILSEAGVMAGSAALVTEYRKHDSNDLSDAPSKGGEGRVVDMASVSTPLKIWRA